MATKEDSSKLGTSKDEPGSQKQETNSIATTTFVNLRKRLKEEERPAGLPSAVVLMNIGDENWVIDLRDGLSAEQAVKRGETDAPDVAIKISMADFTALLEGRLSAFKAYTSKRLVVTGEMRLLRSLSWLWEQPTEAPQEQGATRVRVTDAKASGDHGTYRVQIEEGAACWSVWRRWRELKELTTALASDYGRGTPFNLPLPTLQLTVRSSTSSKLLRQRQLQMEAHLNCLLTLIACSPRTGTGPAALLHFLGSSPHGNLSAPSEAALLVRTLSSRDSGGSSSFPIASKLIPWSKLSLIGSMSMSLLPSSIHGMLPRRPWASMSGAHDGAHDGLGGAHSHKGGGDADDRDDNDDDEQPPSLERAGRSTSAGIGGGEFTLEAWTSFGGNVPQLQSSGYLSMEGGVPLHQLRLQLQIDTQAAQLKTLSLRLHMAVALGCLAAAAFGIGGAVAWYSLMQASKMPLQPGVSTPPHNPSPHASPSGSRHPSPSAEAVVGAVIGAVVGDTGSLVDGTGPENCLPPTSVGVDATEAPASLGLAPLPATPSADPPLASPLPSLRAPTPAVVAAALALGLSAFAIGLCWRRRRETSERPRTPSGEYPPPSASDLPLTFAEQRTLLLRRARVTLLFLRLLWLYQLCRMRSNRVARRAPLGDEDPKVYAIWRRTHEVAGKLLRVRMTQLGGMWVKFAMYVAERSAVAEGITSELAQVADHPAVLPASTVTELLLTELGPEDFGRISSISEVPLAVASVSQVHVGWLPSGHKVAIKVQHAGLAATHAQDLWQARRIAKTLGEARRALPIIHTLPSPLIHTLPSPLIHTLPSPLIHTLPSPLIHTLPSPAVSHSHPPLPRLIHRPPRPVARLHEHRQRAHRQPRQGGRLPSRGSPPARDARQPAARLRERRAARGARGDASSARAAPLRGAAVA